MSLFGEDFLIKLGFDVDNDKLKKLRKELDKFRNIKSNTKVSKNLDKEVKQVKQLTSLERKRLAMRKKIDKLNSLGHKGRLTDPSRFKRGDSLDKRNVELDELIRVATNETKKQASIDKKNREEENKAKTSQLRDVKAAAKELERAAMISAARIKQAVFGISQKTGVGKASESLLAESLREEDRREKAHAEAIKEDFKRTADHARRIKAEKLKELILSRRQSRIMTRAVNDFAHAFAAFGIMYAGFASIRDAQRVQFNMENAQSQMEIAFGDKAQGMMDSFVGNIQSLNLGIGKVASMETLSHVAPALRGRFNEADTQGIAKELLIVSKFSGQMQDMAAIARNFGQMTTSLEGEDVNQFADRMKGLMPFIYENLKEAGKISEANRASFMKAKDAGAVVSDDFVKAFRKAVQRITKDEKLLARLGGKLNVAWGALLASIEDARLSFMGKMDDKDNGRTSLSEQLNSTYETLRAFFSRNIRTWRAWGEVLGDVIQGLTWAFLEAEQVYLRFVILLKDILGLDDEAARRRAIWAALGVAMLPVIGFMTMLGLKIKKLIGIFKIFGGGKGFLKGLKGLSSKAAWLAITTNFFEALASGIEDGFLSRDVSKNVTQLLIWVLGLLAIPLTGGLSLVVSDFLASLREDWDSKKSIITNLTDGIVNWVNSILSLLPDSWGWKLNNSEDDAKEAENRRKNSAIILNEDDVPYDNPAYKRMNMYRPLGSTTAEIGTKYGSKGALSNSSNVNVGGVTNTFNINEAESPRSTVKQVESYATKAFEKDGLFNTLKANM